MGGWEGEREGKRSVKQDGLAVLLKDHEPDHLEDGLDVVGVDGRGEMRVNGLVM